MNAIEWTDLIFAHNPIVVIFCYNNRLVGAWELSEGLFVLDYMIGGAFDAGHTCLAIDDKLNILQVGFEPYQYIGKDIQAMLDRPTWADGMLQ